MFMLAGAVIFTVIPFAVGMASEMVSIAVDAVRTRYGVNAAALAYMAIFGAVGGLAAYFVPWRANEKA